MSKQAMVLCHRRTATWAQEQWASCQRSWSCCSLPKILWRCMVYAWNLGQTAFRQCGTRSLKKFLHLWSFSRVYFLRTVGLTWPDSCEFLKHPCKGLHSLRYPNVTDLSKVYLAISFHLKKKKKSWTGLEIGIVFISPEGKENHV